MKKIIHDLRSRGLYSTENIVQAIKTEIVNKNILKVPEGKRVQDLPLKHFKSLIEKNNWQKISRALMNLVRFNKHNNKDLSNWAKDTQQKLSDWVNREREKGKNI